MIPELGQITLVGALLASLLTGILPLFGALKNNSRLMRVGSSGVLVQFLLVAAAFGMLT